MEKTFKERVCETITQAAQLYKSIYLDYEYLIYSDKFKLKKYYIISAEIDNFLHLTGVITSLSAKDFYVKSLSGTLIESDFNFDKTNQSEKSIKGSVRRKTKILLDTMSLLERDIHAKEEFRKNKVYCSLATSDGLITLGFAGTGSLRPKTLLHGDVLGGNYNIHITLVLKRSKGSDKFSSIVTGRDSQFEINALNELLNNCLVLTETQQSMPHMR